MAATTTRKDYAAIAAAKIRQPSTNKRKPRILVYGRNKKGKTRFSATAPNVLILDPESGTIAETKIDPDVWPIDRWEDINDAYLFLKGGGVSPRTKEKYQWVSIDGGTKLANIALRWCMSQAEERDLDRKPNQVGKQDYGRAGEMFKGMLNNFHSLTELGIIITCNERMVEVSSMDDADDDGDEVAMQYVADLPKGARGHVNAMVDVIGRIYTVSAPFERSYRDRATGKVVKKTIDKGVQRRLWVAPHPAYDTGVRTDLVLPDFFPDPTVPKIIEAMRRGRQ